MKSKISSDKISFKTHQSYSVEEILAAGGTTAFGIKMGKNNQTLIKALKESPPIEPFTDEEWNKLMDQLQNDK